MAEDTRIGAIFERSVVPILILILNACAIDADITYNVIRTLWISTPRCLWEIYRCLNIIIN